MAIIEFPNGQRVEFQGTPTDADIEEAATALGVSSATSTPTKKVGFVQQAVRDIASPFMKAGATLEAGAEVAASYIPGGKTPDQARADALKGFGSEDSYLGKYKPFGADSYSQLQSGDITKGEFAKRAGLETAGNLAEIYSYGLAPLKGIKGAGFFKSILKAAPFAGMFGLGEGLQAAGEGKGAGESAVAGVSGFAGSSIGYGVMSKGANLIGNWGAKALQSPAVRAAGQKLVDIAEKTWYTLPEAFTKEVTQGIDYLANKSARRAYNVLKQDFDSTFKEAINSNIDAITPEVNTPELSLGNFQRSLSTELGTNFNKSSALYDNVKLNPTTVDTFTGVNKALNKVPQGFEFLKLDFAKPKTLGQILEMKDSLTSTIPTLDKNGQSFMRDVVSNMLSDARNVLETKNPELLKEWDLGYQSWKKAVDLYTSNPLSELKSVGEVDTFVDKMLNNSLTRPEQTSITNALQKSPETTNLFLESVLRRAKNETPEEGAKTINTFLDNWETLLNPNQVKLLDDVAQFMDQNFDSFIGDMKSLSTGGETTSKLATQKSQIKISELVDKGDFNAIADNFYNIKNSDELIKAIEPLTAPEKKVVGLSLTKNLFDENLPLFDVNPDGTFDMSKFAEAFASTIKDLDKLGGKNKQGLLQQLFTPEQIKGFDEATKTFADIKNVSELPVGDVKRFANLVLSAFYAKIGYPGAAVVNLKKGMGPSKVDYYKSIEKLIDDGYIKKNIPMKIGDLLRMLSIPSGIAGGEVGSGAADVITQ